MRADGGISDAQMVGDSEAAVKWVRAQSSHNGKVGVLGSCSGGRHAFIYACQRKDVDACVDLGRPRGDGRGLGLSLALKTAKELRAALDYPLRPDHVPAPGRIAGERSALHADRRIPDGHGARSVSRSVTRPIAANGSATPTPL